MAVTQIGAVGTAHLEAAGALGTIAATKNGITAGSTVVVRITCGDAFTISQVSNGAGLTRTVADFALDWVGGTQRGAYYSFINHPGGNFTFTATFSGLATFRGIAIIELTPSRFDVGASATGTSAAPSSGNVTPTEAGEYLIGFCMGATTPVKAATWTEILSEATLATDTEGLAQAVKAAVAATWTMTSGIWGAMVAAYRQIAPIARPVLPRLGRQMAIGLVIAHSFVGKPVRAVAAAAPTLRPRHATLALTRTPLPTTRSAVGKRYVPPPAVAPTRRPAWPIAAQVRTPLPVTRSQVLGGQAPEATEKRLHRSPTVALTRLPLPIVRSSVGVGRITPPAAPAPPLHAAPIIARVRIWPSSTRSRTGTAWIPAATVVAPPALSIARPVTALTRLPLPQIRSVVGTAIIVAPAVVVPPPPGPNYYPWPQGGETRSPHSSLGSKRRSRLAKALHEATEKEEKPERKIRRPKPALEIQKQERALEGEARAIGEEPPPAVEQQPAAAPPRSREGKKEPSAPRREAGTGVLRGTRHRATYGALEASAGGSAYIRGGRHEPRYGQLEPEGIENPTPEQIMLATGQ